MSEDDVEQQPEETAAETPAGEAAETTEEQSQETEVQQPEHHRAYYEEEKISMRDIQQHISGPLISVVLHIIIVIVLGTAVMFDPPQKTEKEEVVVEMQEMKVEPPPPPPPPPPQPQDMEFTEATFHDLPTDRPVMNQEVVQPIAEPTVASANTAFSDNLMMDSAMPVVETSKSQLKLSGAFSARSASGRKLALKKYGGSPNTERAVTRALDWLTKVQNEDGSWGDEEDMYNQKVQLTCLALLSYLAHGETTQSEKYGEALMKGLKLVLKWSEGIQDGEENRNGMGRHAAGTDENGKPKWQWNDWYAVARMGIVLAEGYAITKNPQLERGMNRVTHRMIKQQNPEGGYSSHYGSRHKDAKTGEWINHFDLELGGYMYNALFCAFNAGCEEPGLEDAIKKAISAMEKKHALKKGGFTFGAVNKDGGGTADPQPTAVGTLYLYLMGSNSTQSRKGYEWLCAYKPNGKENSELRMDWKNLPLRKGEMERPSAVWYYMTQALFQGSSGEGKSWKRWNAAMAKTLVSEQHMEGYWLCPADKYQHFETKMVTLPNGRKKEEKVEKIYNESSKGGWTETNAKIWVTVYFTLSLEVYYRYLPTFQPDGSKTPLDIERASDKNNKEEEVVDEQVDEDSISLDD